MTQGEAKRPDRRAAAHGVVLLLCAGASFLVPAALRPWPISLLIPLAGYAVVVSAVPRWRGRPSWAQVGAPSRRCWLAAAVVIAGTSVALVSFQKLVQPDLGYLQDQMPLRLLGGWVLGGVLFSLLNAFLEELIFRGVLFSAFAAEMGTLVALVASSAIFGLVHLGGYPPGALGALLAGVYGAVLGGLRIWSGGLLAPVVVHVFADATIVGILWDGSARP